MSDSIGVATNSPEISPETILIVDDQPENLVVLSGILNPDYQVRAVRSGEHALRAAVTEPRPDLILLDVMMPGLDGFTVLEHLRKNPDTHDIPVIFVTARDAPEDEQYGLERGAVDYITKPIRPLIVLARVKAHLEIKRARDRLKSQKDWLEAEVSRRVQENLLIIKEKERIEFQLFQAQKLEAIGTLAGGIAHDFNNILTPVIGYTEIAMQKIPESNPAQESLHQVLAAAYRARDLVKQILSFSRMKEEQPMRSFEISLIVKEALKLLRASLPTTIQIQQNIETGLALVDATQIHQVVVNLCTNAVQAMGVKGVLSVSLVKLELGEQDVPGLSAADIEPGPYLKLSVADTGHGMDGPTVQRVFDPYFTTKEVEKGTGLGLAVVHGIVKRHGGKIGVRSEVGKGSVFEVFFPMAAVEPEAVAELPQDLLGGVERILLVDDEPVIAELGARILKQLGYRVITRTHPEDARDFFCSNPEAVDLLITDYTMPCMTGIELAREILKIKPNMPVILCTGFSELVTEDTVKAAGIAQFVMKPMGRKEWAAAVRKVLDDKNQ
jgi:CheY-like chemotaxis protein